MAIAAPAIRAMRVQLLGNADQPVADAAIVVVDADYPEIVLFNGDPYLRCADASAELRAGVVFYRHVRPYRLDVGA